ncbi:hypothetical protein EAH84_07975 [Sphingomonas oligophenolica]|uniref:Histone n=2 Tax=Sphingomonas oligophenolica TaxID=301154 RepID=A0A502CHP8_9SPHN|nr:hypothetical protein EAH84_07975 [Sphingomonas oligophenolica]
MPHAKTTTDKADKPESFTKRAKTQAKAVGDAAEKAAGKATKAVKNNPKTAAAVGVAVLAAGAAAIAAPFAKKPAKKKPVAKKPAAKA